jgi:hypothetical protein
MTIECGLIHPLDFSNVRDPHGCRLPMGHPGPHEFVSSRGVVYEWEESPCSDCDCDLEAGECCTEFWRKQPNV